MRSQLKKHATKPYQLIKLALCLLLSASFAASADQLLVATSLGKIQGTVERGVRAFRGIPYAKPPIGALRFHSPESASPWEGVLDGTGFPPICTQIRYMDGQPRVLGEEDCLYLNIYTPDKKGMDKAPVLVWIHGGGRRNGDGRRIVADFVRETGTIVVMIQYRLDYLAFMAHPALSAESPQRLSSGNYGYQDAIEALRWVRREISNFGGDPRNLTIGGMSGGGTMVCGLMASPQAAGLFDRAIIQSGGSCWFNQDSLQIAEQRGERWASQLGCDKNTEVTECLRNVPAQKFFSLGPSFENPFQSGTTSYFAAMPMLGSRTGHLIDGQIFPRPFPEAFQKGVFHRIPVMIGIAKNEGRRVYGSLLYQLGAGDMDDASYQDALTGLTGSPELAAQAVKAFPLQGSGLKPIERFADVATAAHYTCPHAELAHAISQFTPAWLYEQQVAGTAKSPNLEMGAYHGFDTELLFGGSFDGSVPTFNQEQKEAAQIFRKYVANFVRNGNPNGEGLVAWNRYADEGLEQHLAFSASPRMQTGLREQSCRFWREHHWDYLPDIL